VVRSCQSAGTGGSIPLLDPSAHFHAGMMAIVRGFTVLHGKQTTFFRVVIWIATARELHVLKPVSPCSRNLPPQPAKTHEDGRMLDAKAVRHHRPRSARH